MEQHPHLLGFLSDTVTTFVVPGGGGWLLRLLFGILGFDVQGPIKGECSVLLSPTDS